VRRSGLAEDRERGAGDVGPIARGRERGGGAPEDLAALVGGLGAERLGELLVFGAKTSSAAARSASRGEGSALSGGAFGWLIGCG
jgi:hypothetical protein